MRSKKMLTKALSGILCAVTLMTSVPINAYADEADMVDQIVQEAVDETSDSENDTTNNEENVGENEIVQPETTEQIQESEEDSEIVVKETTDTEYDEQIECAEKKSTVSFERVSQSAGVGSIIVNLRETGQLNSSSGQRYVVKLVAGTSSDKDKWQESDADSIDIWDSALNTEYTVTCSGLQPQTKYYGMLHIYVIGSDGEETCEQYISLDPFTTGKDENINLEEAFPDEMFRQAVKNSLGNYNVDLSNGIVTKVQLEKIRSLISNREQVNSQAIKNIKGVEYLTNLETLYLDNHEISDISLIANLSRLKWASFVGNEISDAVDLSELKGLNQLVLNENLLSEEKYNQIATSLSKGCSFNSYESSKQRTEAYDVVVEDTYYMANGKIPIYVVPIYKTGLNYTIKYKINDAECEFIHPDSTSPGLMRYVASDLKADSNNTLTVEYYAENSLVASVEKTFTVSCEDAFLDGKTKCVSSDQDTLQIMLNNMNSSKQIESVEIIDKNGDIYTTPYSIYHSTFSGDERLKKIANAIGSNSLYDSSTDSPITHDYVNCILDMRYTSTPVGLYNIRVNYADKTIVTLEDCIQVIGDNQVFVESGYGAFDYDNTGEYYYLQLTGKNIDPSKFSYTAIDSKQNSYKVDYISYKPTYNGVVVKLKKTWSDISGTYVSYTLHIACSGAVIEKNDYNIYDNNGIYYCQFNPVTCKLEVGISAGINAENITVELKSGYSENSQSLGISGSGTVKDGIAYITLKDTEGIVCDSLPAGYIIYVHTNINGTKYYKSMYVQADSTRAGSWYITNNIVEKEQNKTYVQYYSDIKYDSTTSNVSNYKFAITDGNTENEVSRNSYYTFNNDGYVLISMARSDLGNYSVGSHKIMVYYKNELLSTFYFTVKASDKFFVDNIFASRIGEKTRVYISSANIAENDQFEFTFRDLDGNEIDNVKLVDKNLYSDSGYFYFSGLENYRQIYVYVKHKSKGTAVKDNGRDAYFSSENGDLLKINEAGNYTTTENGRIVGISIQSQAYPMTVNVYRPYDTTALVKQITINQSDVDENDYYYFSKNFYQQLPDQDGYYQIVVVDGKQNNTISSGVIGCKEGIVKKWSADVDKSEINLDQTATLTYTGDYSVSVTSTDTNIITVKKADAKDNTKYIITPVQAGKAQIKVTANSETRYIEITVTDNVKINGISLNKKEITTLVGTEALSLEATVTPADAMNDSVIFEVESSNKDVATAAIAQVTARGVKVSVTPIAKGETTIKVKVADTSFEAECKVKVQENLDKEAEVDKVGTLYVLTNTVDGKNLTLKDVNLPEGWSWIDSTIVMTANDAIPVQYYDAKLKRDGYPDMTAALPVAVSKVTGVEIQGKESVLHGETAEYEVGLKVTGYKKLTEEELEKVSYVWTVTKNLTLTADSTVDNSKITVEANADIKKKVKETLKVAVVVNSKTKLNGSKAVSIEPEKTVDDISVKVAQTQPDTAVEAQYSEKDAVLTIDAEDVKAKKNAAFNLEATTMIENQTTETMLTWKTGDSNVVTVKNDKTTKLATLTFKKAGTTYLTATAKDNGAFVKRIVVEVKDYSPIVPDTKYTVNQYLENGVEILYFVQNANKVTSAELVQIDKKGTETPVEGIEVTLKGEKLVLESTVDRTKNQSYNNIYLRLITENKENPYDYKISVTVDTKKPTATVSQITKANLFYTDAEAEFQLKSNFEIASIEEVPQTENSPAMKLVTSEVNCADKTFVLKADGLTSENLNDFKKSNSTALNREIKITFDGYKDSAAQVIKVKVGTVATKPNYAVPEIKFAPNMLLNTNIIDSKTKQEIASEELANCNLTVITPKTGVAATLTGNQICFEYADTKTVNYELSLANDNWTQDVRLKSKLTALKQANVELSDATILLNSETNVQQNGTTVSKVSFKNNSDTKVASATFNGKNAAAVALLNNRSLYLKFNSETQQIEAGINQGCTIKAGSYSYIMKSVITVNGQNIEVKDKAFTIKIIDGTKSKAKITVSANGSINLLDRENSYIMYTPKFANLTAKVTDVELEGSNASFFNAEVVDGYIYVRANANVAMRSAATYKLRMNVETDNGYEGLSVDVNIKPTVKYPKQVAAGMSKGIIYKDSANELTWSMLTSTDVNAKISSIKLVEDKNKVSDNFTFEYDEDGTCSLKLSGNGKTITANKTYSLTFKILFEDEPYNVTPKTFKVKVTVK